MAELIVRSQCRSRMRQLLNVGLNISFPLWGVISPLAMLSILMEIIMAGQQSNFPKLAQWFTYLTLTMSFTLGCLLLKRFIADDQMIVDRQGITLPRLIGCAFNWQSYLPWSEIDSMQAQVCGDDLSRSYISIRKQRGERLKLAMADMEPQFVEQLLLATKMWAPETYDESLERLQTITRTGARHSTSSVSYTDLWDEELSRRFCPTAYVPLEPGRLLRGNSLRVISHLASGGLSALYLAQLDNKQLVVLKEAMVPEGGCESLKEKACQLFAREGALLMKLDHPGIVRVIDCFCEDGRNYMLLEYINGIDLRQLVQQNGPQPESEVLNWAVQIAGTLKHLHERDIPIIHRDLTPDNIVLRNDGKLIVVDFGAANEFIGNATGTFVGKHAFIAPEQLRGKATIHSDIYAFGCTLFFLLTATEPEALSCSNPQNILPSISDELAELIQSCTQLESGARYQSIAQLQPVLRRLAAQSSAG